MLVKLDLCLGGKSISPGELGLAGDFSIGELGSESRILPDLLSKLKI